MQLMRDLWSLIKSKQTALLLFTGVAGYASVAQPARGNWAPLTGALLASICGATVLNMVYDRDIDRKMSRTANRPLAAGRLSPAAVLALGAILSGTGLAWAFATAPLFGLVVLAGWFLDAVVYTVWLKRRTPWSVLWGGISGGMPALAGRTLALGRVDLVGLLLALAVLLWIPTHIMTFSIKYAADYAEAGVPVFPNTHGTGFTQRVISGSTLLAALTMLAATWLLALPWGVIGVAACLGAVLVGLAANALIRPSVAVNFQLFKFASVYMVAAMGLIAFT
ncbi:protoheme IX farnesyltransferase [Symbiobacterium terraclitae]|uniref:Protoheme IX farnesyltransferase n=1 Tax=Symbiobacterium terraclitae TaxID=557451 RepID=A0ABS4JVW1_9FIRM|nr:heme o synthase [Symbiobacterium terraclitae]MBP2019116.1 protoheme IX farnesyltransferase [Symbiobacterium terraclitae]